MAKDTITFALNGEVTLHDFSTGVAELFNLVHGLGKDVAPNKKIEWFIAGLEAGSAIATIRGEAIDEATVTDVEKVVDAYMDVGRAVQQGKQISYSKATKKAIRNLMGVINGRVKSMRFENIEDDVEIFKTPEIFKQLKKTEILKEALGAVRGRVQSMTNRGQLRFTLYDLIDDRAISCYLASGSEDIMREAWGKVAMVEGVVRRDPETGLATTVRGVRDMRIVPEYKRGQWREALGAAPNFLENELPEDVIRKARDG